MGAPLLPPAGRPMPSRGPSPRALASLEAIPAGISSGAAVAAAIEIARAPGMEGKRLVTVPPSLAERYLSTALFDGL